MKVLKTEIREWIRFCERSFTNDTIKQYKSIAKMLLDHIAANGRAFTQEAVENFLCSKLEEGGSRRLWNCYLICIRNFAKWREKKFNIPSPVHKIEFLKQDPPKQRCLTEEEYQLCLQHARGMDRDILILFTNTGIRKEEFRNIKWGDIPIDMNFLRIIGKGRKFRIVPLNENCREVLSHYERLPDDQPLQFTQRYPGGEGASFMLRRITKQLNIPRAGLHSCRHYFATKMIKRGVNIYKLSKILGHSSVQTTEAIYLHLAPIDLLGITDILD